MRPISLQFPRSSFLPFSKTEETFAFFHSAGTSQIAMTFQEQPCNDNGQVLQHPFGAIDMCMSSLFVCSLTWSSSSKGISSLPQIFPLVSGTSWTSSRQILHHWRLKPKKSLSSSLLRVCCDQVSIPIQQQARIFPSLPCADDIPGEECLAALHVPCQIQF